MPPVKRQRLFRIIPEKSVSADLDFPGMRNETQSTTATHTREIKHSIVSI